MTAKDEPLLTENISNSMNHQYSSSSSSSSLLKRKRPLKIEIPNVLRELSPDAFKGCPAKESVSFMGVGVGVYSQKGKKKFMEDTHKICSSSTSTGINKDFFGVYDGHGGSKAAEFVAENLHLNVFQMLESNSAIEEGVRAGYLKTDEEFLKQGWGSGTCCVTAVIQGHEMVVSNLGDCRAVVCRGGMAEALTTDHRPTREDERTRIEEQGGYVEMHRGTWRVHGTLAVSRSIGDAHLKDWVMAEPDTQVVCLTPDMQFLILASDGLWEEVSNQEAVDIVMQSCSYGNPLPKSLSLIRPRRVFHLTTAPPMCEDEVVCDKDGSPPSKTRKLSLVKKMKIVRTIKENENERPSGYDGLSGACKKLFDLAVKRGSMDDITVMIIDLARYRSPNE